MYSVNQLLPCSDCAFALLSDGQFQLGPFNLNGYAFTLTVRIVSTAFL